MDENTKKIFEGSIKQTFLCVSCAHKNVCKKMDDNF